MSLFGLCLSFKMGYFICCFVEKLYWGVKSDHKLIFQIIYIALCDIEVPEVSCFFVEADPTKINLMLFASDAIVEIWSITGRT